VTFFVAFFFVVVFFFDFGLSANRFGSVVDGRLACVVDGATVVGVAVELGCWTKSVVGTGDVVVVDSVGGDAGGGGGDAGGPPTTDGNFVSGSAGGPGRSVGCRGSGGSNRLGFVVVVEDEVELDRVVVVVEDVGDDVGGRNVVDTCVEDACVVEGAKVVEGCVVEGCVVEGAKVVEGCVVGEDVELDVDVGVELGVIDVEVVVEDNVVVGSEVDVDVDVELVDVDVLDVDVVDVDVVDVDVVEVVDVVVVVPDPTSARASNKRSCCAPSSAVSSAPRKRDNTVA
jgi:hypothetical protein